jgi:hypothetical protein
MLLLFAEEINPLKPKLILILFKDSIPIIRKPPLLYYKEKLVNAIQRNSCCLPMHVPYQCKMALVAHNAKITTAQVNYRHHHHHYDAFLS